MALNFTRIEARLSNVSREFDGQQAQFGVPSGLNYEDGTSVAYVAAIQEFGAPEVGIPPRSYIRPTVRAKQEYWVRVLKSMIPNVTSGGLTGFDVLDAVGRAAVADIQTAIAAVYEPELSPVTVLLRKWRKEGRRITGKTVGEAAAAIDAGEDPGSDNKPLNDTGYLIASIRNAVNRRPEEFKA